MSKSCKSREEKVGISEAVSQKRRYYCGKSGGSTLLTVVLCIAGVIFFASCQRRSPIEISLELAGDNRSELESVLAHYSTDLSDSLKYQAAVYLIENMAERWSIAGKRIDCFRDTLFLDTIRSPKEIWAEIAKDTASKEEYQPNIRTIKADYLIDNIDFAFETWQKVSWTDSIPFSIFKEYILPYSIAEEPITSWRRLLHEEYKHVVEKAKNPRDAFRRLYFHITRDKFRLSNVPADYSHLLDPVTIQAIGRGTCDKQALLIVSAARALAIPAAYDYLNYWASYSKLGHSWPVYIDEQEIPYNIQTQKRWLQKQGPIHASFFHRSIPFDDTNTPFNVDSLKKTVKVMRYSFSAITNADWQTEECCPDYLKKRGARDVSAHYGLNSTLTIDLDKRVRSTVYLCHFLTGKGWKPATAKKQSGKRIRFEDIGNGIVYLPATIEKEAATGKQVTTGLTNPIILEDDDSQRILNPDLEHTQTVTLLRKYPLLIYWLPNRWKETIGICFEASNDPKFISRDTLHLITQESLGILSVNIDTNKEYRYLRVCSPPGEKLRLNEVVFYGQDDSGQEMELTGDLIFHKIDETSAEPLFDKKNMTAIAPTLTDCWVGKDLGKDKHTKVSRIYYCPWNDGNMIEPDNTYELLYYDREWHSLGEKMAEKDYITYDSVPENALLWLRNLTKGTEERVFTYENGKQRWW